MIYLDNNATTQVDQKVFEKMKPYFTDQFYNASSNTHSPGIKIKNAVEESRDLIAELLERSPQEIIFTSGSTESINLAIKGFFEDLKDMNMVTTSVEHKAVLDAANSIKDNDVIFTKPNEFGAVESDLINEFINEKTSLVSVLATSNEIGTDNNLRDISKNLPDHVTFHTDATQSFSHSEDGIMSLGVLDERVDMISLSGHKFHGPKGIGLLIVNKETQKKLSPIIFGGSHERGLRSGTLNVPGIIGITEALKIQHSLPDTVTSKRIDFENQLIQNMPEDVDFWINGLRPNSPIFQKKFGTMSNELMGHPGNLSLTFKDIQATSIIAGIPELAISTGSACTSANPAPSHVLQEIGLSLEEAQSTIRISLSRFTIEEEIKISVEMIISSIKEYLEKAS